MSDLFCWSDRRVSNSRPSALASWWRAIGQASGFPSRLNEKGLQILEPFTGAIDGARSRDLRLGKPTLYQLSYYRKVPRS